MTHRIGRRAVVIVAGVHAVAIAGVWMFGWSWRGATSGSTGRPKRVHLSHGALAHRLDALARALPFRGDDVCVCRTPPTFIDAFAELFGPLVAGVPSWVLPHPLAIADLARALHDARITRLLIVPSLLAVLLDACPDLGATALRVVITSGEPLGPELAARFFAAAPGVRLVNVYGSTEVAGDATLGDVRGGRVTIGRALAGVTVRIVDEAGRAVRDGEVGELVVSGPVLADGYDDPTLTAARFVRDPDTGDRVFRTGDRGRLVDGGELVLVGRVDDQVKIAGVRVELGEVEHALLGVAGVRAAAVAVGDGRLVAAIVGDAEPERVRARGRGDAPGGGRPGRGRARRRDPDDRARQA